jgi:hypothetical protein
MKRKKTFSIEDAGALDRQNTSNDRNNEQAAMPEMGFHGVPDAKIAAGASQISRTGEPMPHEAPKKRNTPHSRAVADRARIENGLADPEGGAQK